MKGNFKIDYSRTKDKEIYLVIEQPTEENRNFIINFLNSYSISFQEVKENEFKVYFHDWVSLSDELERGF